MNIKNKNIEWLLLQNPVMLKCFQLVEQQGGTYENALEQMVLGLSVENNNLTGKIADDFINRPPFNVRKLNVNAKEHVLSTVRLYDNGEVRPGPGSRDIKGYQAHLKIAVLGFYDNKEQAERCLIQEIELHIASCFEVS